MTSSIWYVKRSRVHLAKALTTAERELEADPSLSLSERIGSIRALLSGMDSLVAPDDSCEGGG